jgi:hypothetical protein
MIKRLTFLFILCILSLNVFSQSIETPEDLAKLLVEALRTQDYQALKKLLLNKDDLLKMNDCECAQGAWEHIKPYQNHFLKNFQSIHNELLETGLPFSHLKYEGLKAEHTEGFLNLHIHVSIKQYHGSMEAKALKTSVGYRLVSSFELLSNTSETKNLFGVENTKAFGDINQILYFNDSCKLTYKLPSGKIEMGDFKKITYYSNDSIYASITISVKQKTCNINHYYKNGNLRDSAVMKICNEDSLRMMLKPIKIWENLPKVSVKPKDFIYNSIYYYNGKIDFYRARLDNDTILELDYRIDGQISEEKKIYKNKIISLTEYDYFGNITKNELIYNKPKAETIEELKTFPDYNTVETMYKSGQYEMPLVNFLKKPEGWFVKLINLGTEFLFWSFQEQAYQQLPDNPFNTGMTKNHYKGYFSDHKFEHPEYTLFYGYPDADNDAIKLALPVYNSLDSISLGALIMAFRNQLLPLLCQENMVIDDELKLKINTYGQILEKFGASSGLNEIRYILEIRKGKSMADEIVKESPIDKMYEIYLKLCLNEIDKDNILISNYGSNLIMAQNQLNYRKDIKIINPEYLTYKWYRDSVEGIFSVKPGTIFKLSPDFYTKRVLHKNIKAQDIENSEILKKSFKIKENQRFDFPGFVQFKIKNPKYGTDSLNLIYVDSAFVINLGFGSLELIDYLYNKLNKENFYTPNYIYSWRGCTQRGYFSQKLFFAPLDSCGDGFPEKANKFFLVPDHDKFNEQYLVYIFMSMAQDLKYLKPAKTNHLKNLYINITNLYNRKWAKESYGFAIDLVVWGYESGYADIAEPFLKKCFIGQTDICLIVEYLDRDKIGDANRKLKEFLQTKENTKLLDQYFKDYED